jgi:DNA-binding NtrC family response regulator
MAELNPTFSGREFRDIRAIEQRHMAAASGGGSALNADGADGLYFNLLRDSELDAMRPLLQAIHDDYHEVLAEWYRLYSHHFGGRKALSERKFVELISPAMKESMEYLLDRKLERYAARARKLGEAFAEQGVPFDEIVLSLHLYEESVATIFPRLWENCAKSFDKLSHIRIVLLTGSYVRSRRTAKDTRIVELESEAAQLPTQARTTFHGMVGASPVMRQLFERIEAAARSRGTILVVGESGTGKELVARAIHERSARPESPFVAVNCAAISKELIESELFGHKRGAFSGANADYEGLFRAAHGGTLFLDEITEMSPEVQSKLLRALQERAVRPVGSTHEIPIDVRLISSTNRSPEESVTAGQLRGDLYYRLQANVLSLAPLRERSNDVPLLTEHFIRLFNARLERFPQIIGVEQEATEALCHYPWPGNVRELSNAIETAMTFGRGAQIRLEELPAGIRNPGQPSQLVSAPVAPPTNVVNTAVTTGVNGHSVSFAEAERELIERALRACGDNRTRAAELLGVSRKKLYARLTKYGLA